jgi:hypothetical protein
MAKRMESEGYEVIVEPGPRAIPFNILGYQPDILATRGNEHVLVEVKTTGTERSLERYKRIADLVAKQSGWRFMLATVSPDVEPDDGLATPVTSEAEIRALLTRLDSLIQSDSFAFAVPYLWSALMAGLRTFAYAKNVPVDATSDLRVINYMYSLGEISHSDYETLRNFSELRNQMTHSITASVSRPQVSDLRDFVGKKLEEWGVLPASAAGAA